MTKSCPIDEAELNCRFTYHAPTEKQAQRYEVIRAEARKLAETINNLCPQSREAQLALTHLDEVVMWANASIARRT